MEPRVTKRRLQRGSNKVVEQRQESDKERTAVDGRGRDGEDETSRDRERRRHGGGWSLGGSGFSHWGLGRSFQFSLRMHHALQFTKAQKNLVPAEYWLICHKMDPLKFSPLFQGSENRTGHKTGEVTKSEV
ncbi:hypothetical protein PIB30_068880 [Stylosanthes scabra]|uniref:Uncharacterized protein n=1 Tax=Stylosanthes scabra TaxID=79078 RepID=A0ABU6ZLM7_9FABA|nr:hypothetical protein [Stylosanthes scabra]